MMYRKLTYTLILALCLAGSGLLFAPSVPGETGSLKNPETLTAEDISRLFAEANTLFSEANRISSSDSKKASDLYQKSLLRFKKIVTQGHIENGKLYYNIGNIYFRTHDIGRAILNYRKAEQYIGNDINLQKNLAFARDTRQDRIEVKQETKILKTVFFWHYDLSSKTRLLLFALASGFLWLFAAVHIFIKRPVFKWVIGITAVLACLLAGSLAVEYLALKRSAPGVIISDKVVARKGNSESYERSFKEPLHAGTEFIVLEERGNWIRAKLPDDRTCWLPEEDIGRVNSLTY
jgi:tetratricopeptide (TPR) repeat protein